MRRPVKAMAVAATLGLAVLSAALPAAAWVPGPAVGTATAPPEPGPAPAPVPEQPNAPFPPGQDIDAEVPAPAVAPGPARAPGPHRRIDAIAADTVELPRSPSPRWAHPISLAFVAGVFATNPIPFPLPHLGLSLGINLGPWLMLEGGFSIPYPMLLLGGRVFVSRGEIAGYAAARYALGEAKLALVPSFGIDVSRDDGTYAFAEAGLIWDRESSFIVNQVGNAIGTVKWTASGGHVSFGLGQRF